MLYLLAAPNPPAPSRVGGGWLGVTGFDEFGFASPHDESGDYMPSVTIVPGPTAPALFLCSSLLVVIKRR